MAVSGSTDFSMTANDLIVAALELLGVRGEEEPLQAFEQVRGIQWLNMMLKAWEVNGVMTWVQTEGSLTLVQADVDYLFGSGGAFATVPVDISDVRITRGGNDMPMFPLSRPDYFAIPNKTSQGYPTQYYYDRQRDTGMMYVWPAPDSVAGTVKFTYRRRIMDMDAGSDNFDLPQEWYLALTFGLALLLSPVYGKVGTPRGDHVEKWAPVHYQVVKDFDVSEGEASIFAVPDQYPRPR